MMRIEKYDKFVFILGFNDVVIENVATFLQKIRKEMTPSLIQIFDAEHIAGKKHLFFATLNAFKAFDQTQNISDNIEMETLLYASGQRQIDKAIEMIGYIPTSTQLAILMILSNQKEADIAKKKIGQFIPGIRDDSVLEILNEKKIEALCKIFNISQVELETMIETHSSREKMCMWLIIEHNSLFSN